MGVCGRSNQGTRALSPVDESELDSLRGVASSLGIGAFPSFPFPANHAFSILARMSGVIAIVGRPNVGKSALFNRIARKRIAIVHDQPGVTRDRVSAEVEWQGRPFTMIDTGGIGLVRGEKSKDVILRATVDQVTVAIDAANAIIFVVNVQEGIIPLDEEVAALLRDTNKPVVLAINKVDQSKAETGVGEFAKLGFDRQFPVSAIHGRGIDSLMDAALEHLPEVIEIDAEDGRKTVAAEPVKLAFVGRPNVGKSSIINALTRSERVIVSAIPGTTRDSVDVPFEVETDGVHQRYLLIDTAGVRKARRVSDSVEFFSVKRTEESIARCDIAILVIDAEAGITEQDKKIADVIVEEKKACIVVINKWDLMAEAVRLAREQEIERRRESRHLEKGTPEPMTTLAQFGEWVQERLFFLDYAPVIFTSATEGFHLPRLLEAIRYVGAQLRQTVPTGILNRALKDAFEFRQPVSRQGHRLKFYYATQVSQSPAAFVMFVNRKELFGDDYAKYLSRELRKSFGYEGCPLLIFARERPKTVESIRKFNPKPGKSGGKAKVGRDPARVRKGSAAAKKKVSKSRRGAGRAVGGKPVRKKKRAGRH